MSITISITNQKGGVGKTTSSVNIAACLSSQGFRTLLIDFDPQGHATEHLGIRSQNQTESILDLMEGTSQASKISINTKYPNLTILPANLRLGKFNQNPPGGRQFVLKKSLAEFADQFDYIIIDCQPSLSLLTLNALTCADYVLLPVQAEFLALDGLSQLIVTLREVQTKLHPRLHVLGIFLTMYDARNRLSQEVQQELQKNFGSDLFTSLIPRNVRLAEAPSFGKSIFDYDKSSSGAQAYQAITNELLQKLSRLQ